VAEKRESHIGTVNGWVMANEEATEFEMDASGSVVGLEDVRDLTDRIVRLVSELRPLQFEQRPIGVDDDLRTAGLNSLATVKLMMNVEVAFDIAIPNEDLHPDNFRSVRAVAMLVSRLAVA